MADMMIAKTAMIFSLKPPVLGNQNTASDGKTVADSVEHEKDLLRLGNRSHLDLIDPSEHDAVTQVDTHSQKLLQDDRNRQQHDIRVKRRICYNALFHILFILCSFRYSLPAIF